MCPSALWLGVMYSWFLRVVEAALPRPPPSVPDVRFGVLALYVNGQWYRIPKSLYIWRKNKDFCLKTVWNNLFLLPSVPVRAEPASLQGGQGWVALAGSTALSWAQLQSQPHACGHQLAEQNRVATRGLGAKQEMLASWHVTDTEPAWLRTGVGHWAEPPCQLCWLRA